MKLYTEKQVMEAYNTGINDGNWDRYKEDIVALKLTPIKLPSEEEIEESETNSPYDRIDEYNYGFIDGANWVKDFILNQKK